MGVIVGEEWGEGPQSERGRTPFESREEEEEDTGRHWGLILLLSTLLPPTFFFLSLWLWCEDVFFVFVFFLFFVFCFLFFFKKAEHSQIKISSKLGQFVIVFSNFFVFYWGFLFFCFLFFFVCFRFVYRFASKMVLVKNHFFFRTTHFFLFSFESNKKEKKE